MDRLTRARHRVVTATDLPGILDVAYDAFEGMLAVLRRHQEDNESLFPAFVMAAAAAANGRDWIAGADSLPPAVPREPAGGLSDATTAVDVARIVALSSELAARLTAFAASTGGAGDRQCCESAAAEAASISALLAGASST